MKLSLLPLILVAVFLPGCGSDENQPERAPRPVRLTPANEVGGFSGDTTMGQNACGSAKVITGSRPGALDFMTFCSSSKVEKVTFVLWRNHPVASNRREAIMGYQSLPKVEGKGALSGRGKCELKQRFLTCSAKIDGPVAISGRLWTEPRSRCAVTVSLVSVSSSGCERKKACLGFVKASGLFRGKPRGC